MKLRTLIESERRILEAGTPSSTQHTDVTDGKQNVTVIKIFLHYAPDFNFTVSVYLKTLKSSTEIKEVRSN